MLIEIVQLIRIADILDLIFPDIRFHSAFHVRKVSVILQHPSVKIKLHIQVSNCGGIRRHQFGQLIEIRSVILRLPGPLVLYLPDTPHGKTGRKYQNSDRTAGLLEELQDLACEEPAKQEEKQDSRLIIPANHHHTRRKPCGPLENHPGILYPPLLFAVRNTLPCQRFTLR